MVSVNRPDVPPINISTAPNPNLPMRDFPTIISDRDLNAESPGGTINTGRDGGRMLASTPVIIDVPPPPALTPKPKPPVMSKGVITSEALFLPKPPYPETAKLLHMQGKVSIQVLIDETGKVVSARALDGPQLLKQVSEKAAFQARFSPTLLGDQPVKVSGVITYNFVLQQ